MLNRIKPNYQVVYICLCLQDSYQECTCIPNIIICPIVYCGLVYSSETISVSFQRTIADISIVSVYNLYLWSWMNKHPVCGSSGGYQAVLLSFCIMQCQ